MGDMATTCGASSITAWASSTVRVLTEPAPQLTPLDEAAQARFEALRAHRLTVAQVEGVPPYVIASDRALRELAQLFTEPPDRIEDLTLAHGIGDTKAQRYGEGILAVLSAVAGEKGSEAAAEREIDD